jgi:signal transduction histidine kinase
MSDFPSQVTWPSLDAYTLEQMLVTLSHRLRTPLTVIAGEASTLQRAYRRLKPDERDQMLATIVEASQQMERTLQHLFLTAQVLQRQVGVQFEPVDLFELTQQAYVTLTSIHGSAMMQSIEINGPLGNQDALIWADARLLTAVLVHLMDNALLYAPPKTPIAISLRVQDTVNWEIHDQGGGIPPDTLAHLTEPFMQRPSDLTQPITGLGLGLPFCQAVLLSHASQLHIQSEIDQGTRCWFSLPRIDAP